MQIDETVQVPFDQRERFTYFIELSSGSEILGGVCKTADEAKKQCHHIIEGFGGKSEIVAHSKIIRFYTHSCEHS